MKKVFISADGVVKDSFRLAKKIFDTGYRPDAMVVLWRGGTPVGIVLHEYFLFRGVDVFHTVIKAASYKGIGRRTQVVIEHLDSLTASLSQTASVLVIDDIFDSGCTLKKMKTALADHCAEIKTATLYYKNGFNQTDIEPDFYEKTTDDWVVFPHEVTGLSADEIAAKDPSLPELLGMKDVNL